MAIGEKPQPLPEKDGDTAAIVRNADADLFFWVTSSRPETVSASPKDWHRRLH